LENLLIWLLIIACLYTGFEGYSWWTTVALGAANQAVFLLFRPGLLSFGLKERGLSYIVITVALSSVIVAVPFFIGRVIGWTFAT